MQPFDLQHRVRDLVEATIQRMGFDLVAVEWTTSGRIGLLRLSIDGSGGITASDCATVSRAVEPLLDADDPIQGRYRLEVSSPGIERPVQRLQDFERFRGYKLRLRLEKGPPRRRYTGVLEGVDGDEVLLRADDTLHRFHQDTIERAHLDLTLEEYQALSHPGPARQEDDHDHE